MSGSLPSTELPEGLTEGAPDFCHLLPQLNLLMLASSLFSSGMAPFKALQAVLLIR